MMKNISIAGFLILILPNLLLADFSRSNSIVTDNKRGLQWQDDSAVNNIKRDYRGAKEYCKYLSLGGKNNWRLPTIRELKSITDRSRYNPAIKKVFKNVTSSHYWSSTTYASDSSYAWNVDFKWGSDYWNSKSYTNLVRCVSPR